MRDSVQRWHFGFLPGSRSLSRLAVPCDLGATCRLVSWRRTYGMTGTLNATPWSPDHRRARSAPIDKERREGIGVLIGGCCDPVGDRETFPFVAADQSGHGAVAGVDEQTAWTSPERTAVFGVPGGSQGGAQPPRPNQGVALDRMAIRTPGRYASEHPSHPEIGRALIDASFRPKRRNGAVPNGSTERCRARATRIRS
jgi:hypothetical protein